MTDITDGGAFLIKSWILEYVRNKSDRCKRHVGVICPQPFQAATFAKREIPFDIKVKISILEVNSSAFLNFPSASFKPPSLTGG